MNSKTLAITAVLAAALLTGIFTTSTMAIYAERDHDEHDDDEHDDEYKGGGDESETNTEQEIKQKNVGSGQSTNNNCALNSIDATGTGQGGAEVNCPVFSDNGRTVVIAP
jgi:hypothetical protein